MHTIVTTNPAPSADLLVNTNWSASACKREDPEMFFSTRPALLRMAKAVCRRCPVKERCLQRALENDQEHGVWGGTDEDDRRRMKRRAARKSASA
ncbi:MULTISPECIES: WhiB family transcriptional regulator [unclassified Streptomyces]|uniref:WhiB family transcriptional regulator n=1 Tax=unclassified Streptomyces TaxID=2593676 RepID=UPI002DD80EFB|nr:WhiB family transcriptional regulator [Streptomyces sp. NBC_01766]WSC24953.1 WhiB family transcriptional regulator [Streptomyces sp. NBC_01766]